MGGLGEHRAWGGSEGTGNLVSNSKFPQLRFVGRTCGGTGQGSDSVGEAGARTGISAIDVGLGMRARPLSYGGSGLWEWRWLIVTGGGFRKFSVRF